MPPARRIRIVIDPATGIRVKEGSQVVSGIANVRQRIIDEGQLAVARHIAMAEGKDLSNPAVIADIRRRISKPVITRGRL